MSGAVVEDKVVKAIRSAVSEEMERLQVNLRRQARELSGLRGELFSRRMGVSPGDDDEWDAVGSVLRDWHLWGRKGTGYEHLPVVKKEELFRAEPEDEESEEIGEEESEALLIESVSEGGVKKGSVSVGANPSGSGNEEEEETSEEGESEEDEDEEEQEE